MTWTKTPPTEPGHYWWRLTHFNSPVPMRVFVGAQGAWCSGDGFNARPVENRRGEWWDERIPEPPMEEE